MKRLFLPILISCLSHLAILGLIFVMPYFFPNRPIVLFEIDKDFFQNPLLYKRPGMKDADKDGAISSELTSHPQEAILLSDYLLTHLKIDEDKSENEQEKEENATRNEQANTVPHSSAKLLPSSTQLLLETLSQDILAQEILPFTNMALKFEVPEGVAYNELNSLEKKYFTFWRRVNISYAQSLIKGLLDMQLSLPQIFDAISYEQHVMKARAVYDKDGNIVNLKIIEWSGNDKLQNLFENTLGRMNKIPNPVQDILFNNELTLSFELSFNKNETESF